MEPLLLTRDFSSVPSGANRRSATPVVDPDLDQAVAVEIEGEHIARGQRYASEPGADDPAVLNAGCNQGDYAAFGRSDCPPIDDRSA